MSTDPHGILYYGIKLGSEWPLEEKMDSETEEDTNGYFEISEAWEEDHCPTKPQSSDYRAPECGEWRSRLQEWKKGPQNVVADWTGCEDYKCYCIHAEGLEIKVEWDEQEELPEHVNKGPMTEHDEWIRKFCERFGLPYSQPKWHVASLYF